MRWLEPLQNMRIGRRLGAGFAAVIALLVVLAAVGVSRIGAVLENTELIVHDRYEKLALAHSIENEVNRQGRALRTALIATDIEIVKSESAKVHDADRRIGAALQQLRARSQGPAELEAMARLAEQRKAYDQRKAALLQLVAAQSLDEGGVYLVKQMLPVQTAYLSALDAFVQGHAQGMQVFGEQATRTAASARIAMIGLAVVALGLSTLVAIGLTRSITDPMARAVQVARTVASGDLSSRVEGIGRDEAGDLLRALGHMNDGLSGIVRQVRESSESIATGSSQIATGSADLSQRTEAQASSLQQTAASMEQMSAAAKQCAEIARAATTMADHAREAAQRGGAVVERVIATMGEIAAGSKRIADITTVIDGIAFQTNILALNASVEAARAGEQGRGFAVVADEVRSLAQRASTAAKEIRLLIGGSVDKVELGTDLVGEAGTSMQQIVGEVQRVALSIAEIDASTQEQAIGIGQIGEAFAALDRTTQQNAALVEESAAAAASLSQQAAKLADLVGNFKL